jgi:hypothetical protein
MRFDNFSFGAIQIDGSTYEHDVIIDRGEIRKRKKEPSKKFREQFGYTPLSIEEEILWQCRQLVIGSGAYGRLPVMQGVQREADRHKIKLLVLPTSEALEVLKRRPKDTIAILHVLNLCLPTLAAPFLLQLTLTRERRRLVLFQES